MKYGHVSMRNEDGTQWLTEEGWATNCPVGERKLISEEDFKTLEEGAKATRIKDSPDNGFLGVYNLKFREIEPDLRPRWSSDVPALDDFGMPITDEFIDGSDRNGRWGLFNPTSWSMFGIGKLGVGYGQRYKREADGKFYNVEG